MHFDDVFTEQVLATGKIEEGRTIRRFFERTGQGLIQEWMVEMLKRMLRHLPIFMLTKMGLATVLAPRARDWSRASTAIQDYIDEQETAQRQALSLDGLIPVTQLDSAAK
jgi:heterodisulfide reductase subunit C